MEYLGKHAGRVKILEAEPKRIVLSDPANEKFTFLGYDDTSMTLRTNFVPNNIRLYKRLYSRFQRPLLDSLNVEDMKNLRGILVLEIKYLRGCDLQWVPKPAGLLSTLIIHSYSRI